MTPAAGRRRAGIILLVKLLVTGGLLAWLLQRADLGGIRAAVGGAHGWWVLAALALHGVGVFLSAVRWRLLLQAQGARASLSYLTRSVLTGIFFNNFLPSTIGGDLARARDTMAHAGSGTSALTVVLVERASGILTLGLFAVAAPFAGSIGGGAGSPAVGFLVGVLLAGYAGFVVLLRPRPLARLRRAFGSGLNPAGGSRQRLLSRIDLLLETLEALARHPSTLSTTLWLALLLQTNVVLHFWCISRSLELPVALGSYFLIVPVSAVLLLLPVSINGIGAREAVYAFLLGRYGVSLAQALAFSWISYGLLIVPAIVGGALYALRNRD